MFRDHINHLVDRSLTAAHHAWLDSITYIPQFRQIHGSVAINMYPAAGSWGGSSVFVKQFSGALGRCGFRSVFNLNGKVDAIIIVDPREDLQNKAFGMKEIRAYRRRNPQVKIIHRVNECDQRKATSFMDDALRDATDIVDHSVFISEWLREYFIERWFDPQRSHSVIYNGADATVYHPMGGCVFENNGPMRLVTHHWSANPMKGFPVYKQLDDLITEGKIENTELWIIGQWPKDLVWRSARTFPPTSGRPLADLLRQCHVYLTASLWEPCGMHHVEGAQCGLPLLFHEDGGGIVEAGRKYGIGFREESLVEALAEMRSRYLEMRQRVFDHMPDGNRMATEYVRVVQRLLANRT